VIYPLRPTASRGTPWLITFVDLVGLLLAFFVLQFAMTSVDRGRLQAMFGTGAGEGPPIAADRADRDAILSAESLADLADSGYLAALLRERFEASGKAEVTVLADATGVRIDLGRAALDSGADAGAALAALEPALDLLRRLPAQRTLRVAVADPGSDLAWQTALSTGDRLAAAFAGAGLAVDPVAVTAPDAAALMLVVAKPAGGAP
jgi:hypothetical protein